MIDRRLPRPEYPRPLLVRSDWANLNGVWSFEFDPHNNGESRGIHESGHLDRTIVVPFVHQAVLSGIGDITQVDNVWYSTRFSVLAEWLRHRLILNFGAVDYHASIWVNGQFVGEHLGGFTPFSFDVAPFCKSGSDNLLVVRAFDPVTGAHPSGKQSDKESHGCMYTRSTGIWQTVWLEPVVQASVDQPIVFASPRNKVAQISVPVSGEWDGCWLRANISQDGQLISAPEAKVDGGNAYFEVNIDSPAAWSPQSPRLYDLRLVLRDKLNVIDHAKSYFGFRDIDIEGDRVLLNDNPFSFRGVLDQGIWPDGLYTAPSDDELRLDIERSIELGFNNSRLHQKVFDPRALTWADRLGYPVWAEFPDWGCDLAMPDGRNNLRREWLESVRRDISHPSIIIWTPLNERCGEPYHSDKAIHDFVRELIADTRAIDPTRPICSASGYEHVTETDIADLHDYDHDAAALRQRYSSETIDAIGPQAGHRCPTFADQEHYANQPIIVSEMGGMWWDTGESNSGDDWGYGQRPESEQEFLNKYREIAEVLLQSERLCGYVYTQLTDVEQEKNGLFTSNRRAKFDSARIRAINQG